MNRYVLSYYSGDEWDGCNITTPMLYDGSAEELGDEIRTAYNGQQATDGMIGFLDELGLVTGY